jgi:uncharacterized protein
VFRTAILIIAIALLVLFVNSWLKLRAQQPSTKQPGRKEKKIAHEAMVRCEYCGTHVPESRAIEADGRHYCSPDHKAAHQRRH